MKSDVEIKTGLEAFQEAKTGQPVVAIVGRPNVGKSTFFNRLTGGRRALAFNRAGVTRDRHYAEAEYLGREFILIDTGGFEPDAEAHDVYRQVRDQALLAIDEADVVLAFFDARQGVLPGDKELVEMLRACTVPVLYVANKADTEQLEAEAYDFYRLGLDNLHPISSELGKGGDALLDALLDVFPFAPSPVRPPTESQEETLEQDLDQGIQYERFWDDETLAAQDMNIDRSGASPDFQAGQEVELGDGIVAFGSDEDPDEDPDESEIGETAREHGRRMPASRQRSAPVETEIDYLVEPGQRSPACEAAPWEADELRHGPKRRRATPSVSRVALVGRPNVGKSSLANRILGTERQVIHPEAGTTRDSIDIPFVIDGQRFVLIDTAGVRRKARISDKLEQFTVIKAFKAVHSCDVALLLIDATEGVTAQEKRLAGMIEEKGKGVAIIVNKWDLMKGKVVDQKTYAEGLLRQLEHIRHAPVHFISALTGMGISGILPLIQNVSRELEREIPTAELNRMLVEIVHAHHPPLHEAKMVRIYYGLQVRTRPPTFLLFCNYPKGIRSDYRRYIENQIRARYGFVGAPVHLVVRTRNS